MSGDFMLISRLLNKFGAYSPSRTWKLVAVALPVIGAYLFADSWLSQRTGWPQAFGLECSRSRCSSQEVIFSYKLLNDDDIYQYLMFVVVNLPAIVFILLAIAAAIYARRQNDRAQ